MIRRFFFMGHAVYTRNFIFLPFLSDELQFVFISLLQ